MANNIVRFDPFEDLSRLQREMNRLFDDSYGVTTHHTNKEGLMTATWAPAVDVSEDENRILMNVEVPGVKPEDLEVEMSGDTITIRGEKKFEDTDRKGNYVRMERSYGSFMRTFTLNVPVKTDEIAASFKDGVLTLTIPKSEAVKPKKVLVKPEKTE